MDGFLTFQAKLQIVMPLPEEEGAGKGGINAPQGNPACQPSFSPDIA